MATTDLGAPAAPAPASPASYMQRSDWGLRLLAWAGLGPVGLGLLACAYAAGQSVLLPMAFDLWDTPAVQHDALRDWPYLVIAVVSVPLQCAYYAWQPRSIQRVYDAFASRVSRDATAPARATQLVHPLAWPIWQWLALALGLLQVGIWLSELRAMRASTWLNAHPLLLLSAQPLRFLAFYTLVLIVVRQVIVMIGLNRFFAEHKVDIAPLHPDRAGGLRMLGDYVLQSGFVVALIGLDLSMSALRGQAVPEFLTREYYLELVLFCVLAPAVLIVPLWTVHRRMLAAKAALLEEIAQQFDHEYHTLLDGLRHDQLQPDEVSRLEAVQKIYHITAAAPSWPFNVEILSKFGAAVLLPLLVPLAADLVVDWLTR